MKKSIIISLIISITCNLFADIAPAESPDTIYQNDVKYTRSGVLGDNSYIMTDLVHSNFVKRGTNCFTELDDDELEAMVKNPLYGSGFQYQRKSPTSATITNPYTGDSVYAYCALFQNGFEYANVDGKYDCIREHYNGSNAAFMWSTNYHYGINGKKIAFPNPEASNDPTILYQDALGTEVNIIADREWIIQILHAMSNNKLTIIKDNSSEKFTITISK